MSPQITISEHLFSRLQQHAVPLVDTIETLMARAIDALDAVKAGSAPSPGAAIQEFNPNAPPSLTHTTVRSIKLQGKLLPKSETYWNSLMYAAVRAIAEQADTSQDMIKAMLIVPHADGEHSDKGYRFLPEVGISIQGQDANSAWQQVAQIALVFAISIEVVFTWQDNEKAAMPGVTGTFKVNCSKSA